MWHTYTGPALDVSLSGGATRSWTYVGQILDSSAEHASFYMPLESDRGDRKTAYVGLERVWRTTEAGGATGATAANTSRYCNEFSVEEPPPAFVCGDWKPLGVTKLTGPEFGADKRVVGDDFFLSWIHQSPDNPDTAYVATRAGRLFRTQNLRAPNPANVTFTQIDAPSPPGASCRASSTRSARRTSPTCPSPATGRTRRVIPGTCSRSTRRPRRRS